MYRLAVCFVFLLAASGQTPPFDLTWVEGKCLNCDGEWWLDSALFASRMDAWAIGANGPTPGHEGMGERILLHTTDGGRTWKEVPDTRAYATPPGVAFLDPERGWIETRPSPVEEPVTLETHDAGKTWSNVTGKFPVFPCILNADHWWGVKLLPAGGRDGRMWRHTLARTSDGGRTWAETPLPYESGDFPLVHFLSANHGWIGTATDGRLTIFRTTDGGKSWEKSVTPTPKPALGVMDLSFADPLHGWVIASFNLRQGYGGSGSYILATSDGGKTWTLQESEALRAGFAFWVKRLTARMGFVYMEGEDQRNARTLAYTSDAGTHWQAVDLPGYVTACQPFAGDLLCSAQLNKKLAILTIHPK